MKRIRYILVLCIILFAALYTSRSGTESVQMVYADTRVAAPEISEDGYDGVYHRIVIEAGKGSTIYYTLDGTEPSAQSKQYKDPFILEAGKKYSIKAVAYSGKQKSTVTSRTYNDKLTTLGKKVKSIVDSYITDDLSGFGKVMVAMRYFQKNVKYDVATLNGSWDHRAAYNEVGALVDNLAVCEGYSEGFKLLMERLNIPCKKVVGTVNWYGRDDGHAWNMVKYDGKWYLLEPQGGDILMSDKEFQKKGYSWSSSYPDCPNNYADTHKSIVLDKKVMDAIYNVYGGFKFVDVSFKKDVTSIPENFCYNRDSIERVTLPSNITRIGVSAFANCDSLRELVILNGVNSLGDYSFESCIGLAKVTIPGSVKRIGKSAFCNCTNLKELTIQDGVTEIGEAAFSLCTKLQKVMIPGSVKTIKAGAFEDCTELKEVIIEEGVTVIEENAFRNCTKLEKVVIPGSLKKIADYAFWSCSNLKEVTINNGVNEISDFAFAACTSLEKIMIPGSVKRISNSAFSSCGNLKDLTISDGVEEIGECAFYECTGLIQLVIPGSVRKIETEAFRSCNNLQELIFNKDVTGIDVYAFLGSENIRSVTFPASVEAMTSIWLEWDNIESVVLSEGTTAIADNQFSGYSFTSITLPDSLISIGEYAFESCSNLSSIELKAGLKSIGTGAFSGCVSLLEIKIPGSVDTLNSYTFECCYNLETVVLEEGLQRINEYVFSGSYKLKDLKIPSSAISIDENALSDSGMDPYYSDEDLYNIDQDTFDSDDD